MPGVLWPALSEGSDALTLSILGQLLTTQWWPAETLLRRQLRQLTELVAYSAQTVPYYRTPLARFARPKRPLSLEDWRDLPILRRDDLAAAGTALVTRRPLKDHGQPVDVPVGGATGQAGFAKRNAVTERFRAAVEIRGHLWHRRGFEGKLARLGLPNSGGAADAWVACFPTGPLVIREDAAPADAALEWLAGEAPDYLTVSPEILRALLDRSAEGGARPEGLREVLTVGSGAAAALRAACADLWDTPLCDVIAAPALGIVAIQCPDHAHYLVQAEDLFCEVLDPNGAPCEPGETGRLVVTPLHNFSMPLIRYETGLEAELGEPCESGRGLPVLNRVNAL